MPNYQGKKNGALFMNVKKNQKHFAEIKSKCVQRGPL